MNITTLIVLAWLFDEVNLTKAKLKTALDEDAKVELEDYEFGQLMLIADLDKFAVEAKKMALMLLMREVRHGINILLPKDMEKPI